MILPNSKLEEGEIHLRPNSKLVLYTDGVFEAKNQDGEYFGTSRLKNFLREFGKNQGAVPLGNQIKEKIQRFVGKSTFADDYTLVILEIVSPRK